MLDRLNHIFNEADLGRKLQKSLNQYTGSEQADMEKAQQSLAKQLDRKSPDLPYTALSIVNEFDRQEKISLPADVSDKFPQYLRLKEIRKNYNDGADWVGVGFGVYNGFAAVFAFFLMFLSKITNRRITHMISLFVGGFSYLAVFWVQDTSWILLLPFVGIGLAWASILAIPYAILTGSLPSNKMGVYMGIFNFFLVIPQILAASLLGFMVKSWFDGEAIYALVLGGVSLLISGIVVLFVKDDD